MKITIEAETKEIAELVREIQILLCDKFVPEDSSGKHYNQGPSKTND